MLLKTCNICGKEYFGRVAGKVCSTNRCKTIYYHRTKLIKKFGIEKFNQLPKCRCCGESYLQLAQHLQGHKDITYKEYKEKFNPSQDEVITNVTGLRDWYSNKVKGNKNPAYNHGGKFSPFSKKFVSYKELTEEETELKIKETFEKSLIQQIKPENQSIKKEYWLKKGYTEQESVEHSESELKKRTFSLDKCIEKNGESEGTRIWQERQDKWQQTLKNKPKEEMKRINKSKAVTLEKLIKKYGEQVGKDKWDNFNKTRKEALMNNRSTQKGYSDISQELFWEIQNRMGHKCSDFKFATLNEEYLQPTERFCRFLDFYSPSLNKYIEFDGDYWHKNREKEDKIREEEILKLNPTIKILRIKECEYNQDKEAAIKKCIDFLEN